MRKKTEKRLEVRKVPITMRALMQRINRALAKRDGCVHGQEWPHVVGGQSCIPATELRKARGARMRQAMGDFMLVHASSGGATPADPMELAKTLDVLSPWEAVEEE